MALTREARGRGVDVRGPEMLGTLATRPPLLEDFQFVKFRLEGEVAHLRLDRPIIGQKDALRAAFDDGRSDAAPSDVGKRLGGENHGSVLLAQCFQPLPQLAGKIGIVKREPALINDDKGRPPIKAVLNAVKQIGKHRRRDRRAHQAVGLEGLYGGFAKGLVLRIKDPTVWSPETVRLKSTLECVCLKKNRETRQCPFLNWRRSERGQCRPQEGFCLGGNLNPLTA